MNPKNLKEIIDTASGILTGVLSTIILYACKEWVLLDKYKESIPAVVGALVLVISLCLMAYNKKEIDDKKEKKTIDYKKEIAEKIERYTNIVREEKDDSAYKKTAEENLTALLKKDMALLEEMEMEREALNRDSELSDSIISSYMGKLKATMTKKENSNNE